MPAASYEHTHTISQDEVGVKVSPEQDGCIMSNCRKLGKKLKIDKLLCLDLVGGKLGIGGEVTSVMIYLLPIFVLPNQRS